MSGKDGIEFLLAGASAVQVGTAALADPRAPWRIQDEMNRWLDDHGVADVSEIIGAAHE